MTTTATRRDTSPTRPGKRPSQPALDAVRDIAAVSPAVVPFGVTLGITAATAGTGTMATLVGAAVVYGGSAQLTTITTLHLGAGLVGAVVAGAVVGARLLLYGAALEPWFRGQPRWFRLLAPHFVIDQTFLATTARGPMRPAEFRRYWGWLGATLLFVWTGSVALGLATGPLLPPLPHLGLVGTALFVAMLVPRLTGRNELRTAAISAGVALAAAHVLPSVGILAGAAAGVLIATATDRDGRS